jgi:leader peptidase (prepilin peptidase)/N-methyltransferase
MSNAVYLVAIAILGAGAGYGLRPQVARFDAPVPARVPVTEVSCGALFALAAHQYQDSWRMVPVLVLVAACVALSVVDFVQYRLPNAILFPAMAASAVLVTGGELIDGEPSRLVQVVVGALVYSGLLFVMHVIQPGGMGFGDVKLALLLGGFLGWVSADKLESLRAVMLALFIGSALGVVLGFGRMIAVKVGGNFLPDPVENESSAWHKTTFPFGPPLMAGTLAVVLWPGFFLG